ncbi:DUF1127 domain-containing protein [Enterovirga aerilata]|uniref:DUF1127 domain-containing protein n=1 Tax=Enterovirga aerilata TaxID=2730920 RepID=A0A849I5K0_9HYPH|nr:DUF1127 domain-containing protein [Enterovirga sp. DB1703]NNM72974.1 DUF1127 domain-containing protein [Enterovirga sp. DB1703]
MITTETAATQSFGRAAALRHAAMLVLRTIAGFVRALIHRREVRKLLELDERSLRDIGLIRNDVIGALDQPLVKDPSVILLVRSVDRRRHLRAGAPASRRVKAPARAAAEC